MSRPLLIRLLLSALVLACFARVSWQLITTEPSPELPFRIEHVQGPHPYVLRARAGVPLPPPLADGQTIDLPAMQAADRAILFHPDTTPAGTVLTLAVRQGRQSLRATVATRLSAPEPRLTSTDLLELGTDVLNMAILLAVALLTLWRGRDGTAWALCAFGAAVLLINFVPSFQLPPLVGFWLRQAGPVALPSLVINPVIYVLAESLVGAGLSRSWRAAARIAVASFALTATAARVAGEVSLIYTGGTWLPPDRMEVTGGGLMIPVIGVAVLVLVLGYPRAAHENRLRMRWVMWNTGLLVASGVVTALMPVPRPAALYFIFNSVVPGIGVLGYLYAILRTRIVDVTFVVDRALVYSVITAMLFGVFSLLEQVLHRFAVGEQLGWILQALTAALLAAVLSPLHRLLDSALERVFFHELRETVSALRSFATESAFFEKEETLLARALTQVLRSGVAAAIYERNGARYELRQGSGEHWPEAVDIDDPLFLKLRAGRREHEIRGLGSAAGTEGVAFPMTVGQTLTGAVILTPRPGEKLNRDVRDSLAELARSVGTSLYLLRYRDQARLIAEIAAGGVDQAAARERAAALMMPV